MVGMCLETQGKQPFGGESQDFGWDIPGVLEKFEEKSLRSTFGPVILDKKCGSLSHTVELLHA